MSLTFEKALELAISMETAKKSVNVLQGAVHKVVNIGYYRCRKGHTSDECKLNAKCFNCGKISHIQRSCKASPQKPRRVTSN